MSVLHYLRYIIIVNVTSVIVMQTHILCESIAQWFDICLYLVLRSRFEPLPAELPCYIGS